MAFEIIQSERIFEGKVFAVRVDQVRMPDGRRARIDVVEHSGAVTMIPVDGQGMIWFVRQHRHPAGLDLLELPAGVMDTGEAPEISADRELREEIGMAAGRLRKVGEFFLAPGYSTEYMVVFLAEDLYNNPLNPDEDEQITIVKVSPQQVRTLIEGGQIRDAKSLAALYLFDLFSRK
jgi:ADP-ribose pyrophosphatase